METTLQECGLCFNNSVFGFCENCSFRLCEKCFLNHKKVTLFKDHTIFPFDKSTQSAKFSLERENDIHEKRCSIHKTDNTSFYCVKDDETICGRCMHADHRACLDDIIDLFNVRFDDNRTDELTSTLKQLEEDISGIDNRVAENLKLNDECKETCMTEITEYIKKLHDRLDFFREKAESDVNMKHTYNENNIRVVGNKCKEAKERITKECAFIYDLSHKKHERHLFVVSKRLGKDVDELKAIIRQSNLENNIEQFSFLPNKAVECTLQNNFTDIGKLQETCDGSEEVVEDMSEKRHESKDPVVEETLSLPQAIVSVSLEDDSEKVSHRSVRIEKDSGKVSPLRSVRTEKRLDIPVTPPIQDVAYVLAQQKMGKKESKGASASERSVEESKERPNMRPTQKEKSNTTSDVAAIAEQGSPSKSTSTVRSSHFKITQVPAMAKAIDKVTQDPVMAKAIDKTTPLLVIAIDIGSYASGYAWLWRWEYENTPLAVHTNPNWQHGSHVSQKTLTALLLKPDKTIAAFGYAAIEMLCNLELNHKDHEDWYFFQGFKMALHSKKECVDFNQTIEDYKGRHLPASFVFGCVITYFKDHALRHFKENKVEYLDAETKWVVTIPAIWTDSAKSIMREAARKANIRDSNLTLALEPECAAIYCQKLPRGQFLVNARNSNKKYAFEPGSTVMVVDMGGGTVDITTVEVNEDLSLKHVHKSGGGAWGGMRVNDEVLKMLWGVFGNEVFDVFQDKNRKEFIDLQMAIETQKRQVSGKLVSLIKQIKGDKFQEVLQTGELSFRNTRLCIPMKKVFDFSNIVIKDICEFITNILEQMQLINQVTAVVVVGGFANSDYVTYAIRKDLETLSIPVIRPYDAELSILKGAVLFGHNEGIVTSRIMPRTYGVACTMEYDKKI